MSHVTPHLVLPQVLGLYFAGDQVLGYLLFAWACMDSTTLYASDRGIIDSKTPRTGVWAASVALGFGARFLHDRGWTGRLVLKGHQPVEIFDDGSDDPHAVRTRELLTRIEWEAERITVEENSFCYMLCMDAYRERKMG